MYRRKHNQRGFTLVELLVVLAIIVLLLAIALPMMTPPLEQRRIREASRGVVATLAAARDRAIASGRPYGVRLERYVEPITGTVKNNVCLNISYVAQPVPYAGDSIYSRMIVSNGGVVFAGIVGTNNSDTWANGPFARVHFGDQVKLNYCGHLYTIMGGTVGDPVPNPSAAFLHTDTMPYNVTTVQTGPGAGLPYQVFRQPQKTGGPPYELPESTVVDLSASGMLTNEFGAASNGHVTIMFGPNGNIDRVHYGSGAQLSTGYRPTSPIYLMIGRSAKVGDLDSTGMSDNVEDLTTLWVSINPQTGLIQSNANCNSLSNSGVGDLFVSRTYARNNQGMGGR